MATLLERFGVGSLIQAGKGQVAEVVPGGLRGIGVATEPRFLELGGFGSVKPVTTQEFEQFRTGVAFKPIETPPPTRQPSGTGLVSPGSLSGPSLTNALATGFVITARGGGVLMIADTLAQAQAFATGQPGATIQSPKTTVKDIPIVPTSDDLDLGTTGGPTPPPPVSPIDTAAFVATLQADVDTARKRLDATIAQQRKDIQAKTDATNKRIADIESKQRDILETDIQPLLQPFRETLEKTERERLKVEENFFANQNSVNELDALLTQLREEVTATEEITGLTAIRSPRIAKIKEDVAARVGIIEAVMASRNNQITVAENLINRSVTAIEADRKDQLTYYESLLNFESNKKDAEGKKILDLSKDDKDFVNAQINLITSDLNQSQANVNFIKDLMRDPDTADFMEQAGVKLTDPPEVVNSKMAEAGYRQEVTELHNSMAEDGFDHIPSPEFLPGIPLDEIVKRTDSRGQIHQYRITDGAKAQGATTASLTEFDRAVEGGFTGSFLQFLSARSAAGRKPEDVDIPEDRDQRVQNLLSVGLEPAIMTSTGALRKGESDKILAKGVPPTVVTAIWNALKEGISLDDIRTDLTEQLGDQSVAFGHLDNFMQALQEERGGAGGGITNPFQ